MTIWTVVKFADGKALVEGLRDKQKIFIYGLPAGAHYEVSEINLPGGFTQTSPAEEGQPVAASGITGPIENSIFVNAYAADMGDAALPIRGTKGS